MGIVFETSLYIPPSNTTTIAWWGIIIVNKSISGWKNKKKQGCDGEYWSCIFIPYVILIMHEIMIKKNIGIDLIEELESAPKSGGRWKLSTWDLHYFLKSRIQKKCLDFVEMIEAFRLSWLRRNWLMFGAEI